jgi:hypothetical protein
MVKLKTGKSNANERKECLMTEELTPQEFLDKCLKPDKESDHICWDCLHLKPVIEDSSFPPADIIGWCKKIHFPHYWCVADFNVVKKCYAFEGKKKK